MHPLPTLQNIGKSRGLQQCATREGVLSVLAIDHRGNLRRSLNPSDPNAVSDEALSAFKQEVVSSLAPESSAVLLDPEYGVAPVVAARALPGACGLIVSLERTGYSGDANDRRSELLPGWDAARAGQNGANAVKLLVYYHPDAPSAPAIEALVAQVGAMGQEAGLPLFLESLSYSPDPAQPRLSPGERRRIVIESARRLTALPGVDVLKSEFPLDVAAVSDERAWLEACRELTEASRAPWVLLSAGVDFETYLRQVEAACRGGASGVAVGRAVWNEATSLAADKRHAFLNGEARARMARVTALCRALARPCF